VLQVKEVESTPDPFKDTNMSRLDIGKLLLDRQAALQDVKAKAMK